VRSKPTRRFLVVACRISEKERLSTDLARPHVDDEILDFTTAIASGVSVWARATECRAGGDANHAQAGDPIYFRGLHPN
jgi:hypothetical protein